MKKLNNFVVVPALIATFTNSACSQLLAMEQVQEKAAISFLEQLGDLSGKWILDIGCGKGNVAAWMARTAEEVLALDEQAMIEQAKSTHDNVKNLGFISISGLLQLLVGPFVLRQCDLITSFFWLDWIDVGRDLLKNFYDHLKPGGYVLFSISAVECSYDDLMHVLEHYGFKLVSIERKNIELQDLLWVSGQKPLIDETSIIQAPLESDAKIPIQDRAY